VQFLADESCDFGVVRALRAAGHDVTTAADLVGGADDTVVAGLAVSEARILLTENKDFGQLAYATGHVQSGVILIRLPAGARRTVGAAVAQAVSRFGVRLVGSCGHHESSIYSANRDRRRRAMARPTSLNLLVVGSIPTGLTTLSSASADAAK